MLVTKLWSHEHIYNMIWFKRKNFVGDVIDRDHDVITFIQNTIVLRRPGVVIFADIIKIITSFIKHIFKDSRTQEKLKELKITF